MLIIKDPFPSSDTIIMIFNKNKFIGVISGESVIGIGSMIGLNSVWYKDFPRTSFHFFDDSREWLQMDKAGHVVTSCYIGIIGTKMLRWSGVKEKKAIWFGGALGFAYQSGLEILDGFSSGWGFSWSDVAANAGGSLLCIAQELLWKEQRITLKFSDHCSRYANYRPELLGSTTAERIFKDYNGQTYWASVNIASFIKRKNKFPKWANVALGYTADGMTGGSINPSVNSKGEIIPYSDRNRKFVLSLDADLWRIKKMPHFLKFIARTFGFIKVPFPAMIFTKKGIEFSPIYF